MAKQVVVKKAALKKDDAEETTKVVDNVDDELRKEAEELKKASIPNDSWVRYLIYDIRYSDNTKKSAEFNNKPPSLVNGFTIRMAIIGYVKKIGNKSQWVKTLDLSDLKNITVPEELEGLYIKAFEALNDYKLKFAKLKEPKSERQAVLAYATWLEQNWGIPMSLGVEFLVTFAQKNKSPLSLEKDFPHVKKTLPKSGVGIQFEAFRRLSSYVDKNKKKQIRTNVSIYDNDSKQLITVPIAVIPDEMTNAIYDFIVKQDAEREAKKKEKESGDTSFNYGANVPDELDYDKLSTEDEETEEVEYVDEE